jgi:hypothetical protein
VAIPTKEEADHLVEMGAARWPDNDEPTREDDTPPSELPEDFPARDELVQAGILTLDQVAEVKDLTEIEGIGKATAEKVTAAHAELTASEPSENEGEEGDGNEDQDGEEGNDEEEDRVEPGEPGMDAIEA